MRRRGKDDDPTPLVQGLDLFHIARHARTVLGGVWRVDEAAWRRAESALGRAHARIAGALPELGGKAWARTRTRNFLGDHRSLAFLDRMHERLAEAMAWRWWGRHLRRSPASCPGSELVRSVAWGRRFSGEE